MNDCINQSVTVPVRRNVKCILAISHLSNFCPKLLRILIYKIQKMFVSRKRKLVSCGTICDMEDIDVAPISV